MCVYHIRILNEKKGHGFPRDQKGVYGRVWREERDESNDVIILYQK